MHLTLLFVDSDSENNVPMTALNSHATLKRLG